MLRRFAVRAFLIGAVVLGFVAPSTPAGAAAGDSVAAIVTGTTTVTEAPDLFEARTHSGSFDGVVITGVFTSSDPAASAYAGEVTAGSISFTTTETLLEGSGTIDDGSFSGSSEGGLITISGEITDGSFDRIGTVARAELEIRYEIERLGVRSEGHVRAVVEVTAIPGAGETPGDPASSLIVGTVVGDGTGTLP